MAILGRNFLESHSISRRIRQKLFKTIDDKIRIFTSLNNFVRQDFPYDARHHDGVDAHFFCAVKLPGSAVPDKYAILWFDVKLSHANVIDLPFGFCITDMT